MCSQTDSGFWILLRETFCNSTAMQLINKYAKGAVVQISVVFGRACHVAFPRVIRNLAFYTFI